MQKKWKRNILIGAVINSQLTNTPEKKSYGKIYWVIRNTGNSDRRNATFSRDIVFIWRKDHWSIIYHDKVISNLSFAYIITKWYVQIDMTLLKILQESRSCRFPWTILATHSIVSPYIDIWWKLLISTGLVWEKFSHIQCPPYH